MGRTLLEVVVGFFVVFASFTDGLPVKWQRSTVHNPNGPTDIFAKKHPSKTPPMGFNTWNAYRCRLDVLNEANVRRSARMLNETGLVAAGYDTYVIDDCWSVKAGRDKVTRRLLPDPDRFPSGMLTLGRRLRELGFKFGMYADAGTLTCERYPGTKGFEILDAQTFAEWEVDYLKVDGCFNPMSDMKSVYTKLSKALVSTDREILLSCSWPAYALGGSMKPREFDWQYLSRICDTWRLYFDIQPSWDVIEQIMDYWATWQTDLAPATARGAWNDPDFLQVGHSLLSPDEGMSQMAVWSIIAAPLILSTDVMKDLDPVSIDILTNHEIIAINQEFPPRQGLRVAQTYEGFDIWARPMNDKSLALVVVNRQPYPQPFSIQWDWLWNITDSHGIEMVKADNFGVRDLWKHKDLGVHIDDFVSLDVPSHGCLAFNLY